MQEDRENRYEVECAGRRAEVRSARRYGAGRELYGWLRSQSQARSAAGTALTHVRSIEDGCGQRAVRGSVGRISREADLVILDGSQ